MKKVVAALIVLVILAAAGWLVHNHNSSNNSSSNTANNSSTQSTQNSTATTPAAGAVTIKNMMFTPSQITVTKGATVTWTNNDTVAHTVVDDLSNVGGPASGDIAPGSSYSFTFNKTGSFQYHCTIHPSMRGTIVVK